MYIIKFVDRMVNNIISLQNTIVNMAFCRKQGTIFSFRSLLNKIAIAVGNVLMLAVVDNFDEKSQESKLKAFREEKERKMSEELNALAEN